MCIHRYTCVYIYIFIYTCIICNNHSQPQYVSAGRTNKRQSSRTRYEDLPPWPTFDCRVTSMF